MKHRITYIGFFITAGLYAWMGIARLLSGDTRGSVFGMAMAVFWFIFGFNIKRKQKSVSQS
jgi:hypothetical protein